MSICKLQKLSLSKLRLNTGQIPDVPKNPRFIKDERFESLKKSIEDAPEMLELREIVAYDLNGELVIIMGNMRYRAMKELGFKDAPVKILPSDTSANKLREYIVKDNIAFGQNDWDVMANEFDIEELQDWGLECDFLNSGDTDIDGLFEEKPKEEKPKEIKIEVILPEEMEGQKDEVKKAIEECIAEFEGIKVK